MIPATASDPAPSHPSVLQRPREIYRPFTSAELGLLRGYARDVRELGAYRFFEQVPSQFKLFGAAKPLMTEPDPEAVRAAVTLFRQLYLHTEPASFVQIMGLLKRNVHERGSPYRDEAIAEVQDLRIGQAEILRAGAGVTLVINGTTVSVEKIIDTYLHGYYLHAHNEKARLAEMLDNLPPLPRFTFYTVIFKLTKLYWIGANVVDLALCEPSLVDDC